MLRLAQHPVLPKHRRPEVLLEPRDPPTGVGELLGRLAALLRQPAQLCLVGLLREGLLGHHPVHRGMELVTAADGVVTLLAG